MTRNIRRDFENNLGKTIKTQPNDFWRYAKTKLKSRLAIPSLSTPDGSYAITPKDKANVPNNYFSSVFTREDLENIPDVPNCSVTDILSIINITHDVVHEKLNKLNQKKSAGGTNTF